MKNVEKPLVFLGFLRSGQPQLASKIGLEAVLSQLEANLRQLEANLRQLEANLSQLEASWSQHEANLSQLEANLSQLGPTCGCQAGGCQAGGCQTGGCQAGGCQSGGCQAGRPAPWSGPSPCPFPPKVARPSPRQARMCRQTASRPLDTSRGMHCAQCLSCGLESIGRSLPDPMAALLSKSKGIIRSSIITAKCTPV